MIDDRLCKQSYASVTLRVDNGQERSIKYARKEILIIEVLPAALYGTNKKGHGEL